MFIIVVVDVIIVNCNGRRNNLEKFFQMYEKKICFFSILIILIIIAILIYNFLLMPNIRLKGSRFVELDYLDKYVEEGYSAYFLHDDITDKVVVKNNINSKKLGNYEVEYMVNVGGFKRKVVRKVKITDKTAPVIKLDSDDTVYVCPGEKFSRDKFTAIDAFDGDVSDNVVVENKNNEIIYSVIDKHGNKASVKQKIIYEDKTAPIITLNGSDLVYVFIGDNYNELGVNATDNCDDLTDAVITEGNVNVNVAGTYDIVYSVSDKAGNKASIKRTVIVSERNKKGTIYLTFDDGPKRGTTDVILDILKEEGVKATFFVTNSGPDDLIKRAYDEGHTIGLHSASHSYSLVYSSVDSYFHDLDIVSNRVKNITGEESKIIRFIGGSSNTVSRKFCEGIMSNLTGEVLKRGYRYYDWNVSAGDAEAGGHTASEIADNVIKSLSKNRVNMVLMHDIKTYTRDALRTIIRYGKENGYTFENITMSTEMITQRVNN